MSHRTALPLALLATVAMIVPACSGAKQVSDKMYPVPSEEASPRPTGGDSVKRQPQADVATGAPMDMGGDAAGAEAGEAPAGPRPSAQEAARRERERAVAKRAEVEKSRRAAEEQRRRVERKEEPARAAVVDRERPREMPPEETEAGSTEDYGDYGVNAFVDPRQDRLSTFAIDVDTASYTIARRKLQSGVLPPARSVRVEEFVNHFDYGYPSPDGQVPFGVTFDAAPSPFNPDNVLLRVGVQGKRVDRNERPPVHLTFLVDTSGSMQSADKMGLVKRSLGVLVNNLREDDTVAIATYAGSVRQVLAPTPASDKRRILGAVEDLSARGSTAMSSGLELAYKLAYKNIEPGHVNRVIVLSDGDANVGPASHGEILERISHFTKEGVTLSTIGVGMGNYKDTMMEQLANRGNGNYYYIDSLAQAEKVFGRDLTGTLVVIAKDVKIQVEFDPSAVASYRLVGYENRDVADADFRDDAVDAGEIGAGHNVTALYELRLNDTASRTPATVRIRHKAPDGGRATETTYAFSRESIAPSFEAATPSFRVAASIMAFAEVLRHSPYANDWSLGQVRSIARAASDGSAEQKELLALIDQAIRLSDR